ncbi:MAG: arginase family protein [bacterium]|nr:arginase family protein [bacterium]
MGKKKEEPQVIIMNFSHIYEDELQLKRQPYKWIDCTNIQGTDCYLDELAAAEIEQRMKPYPPEGIHFIDSGNYHYISKLWTDKIREPFSLIVFDHHTDMQPSLFEELLSCGSWVKEVLDSNEFLKKVVLIGAKEELIEQVDLKYKSRIICFSEREITNKKAWGAFARLHLQEPVYISLDKDVLDKKEAVTNWDQGSVSVLKLEEYLGYILNEETVIGIDICGEAATDEPMFIQKEDDLINDNVNVELLSFIRKYQEKRETSKESGGRDEEVSDYRG